MKQLRGTKTAQNLLKGFAGESQARNRYTYYADVAKDEGYIQICEIFLETAKNEMTHGKRFFDYLCAEFKGEDIEITAAYPAGLGSTEENLLYAAKGEHEEWADLYPAFGDVAEQEGFNEIAACFRTIAKAEVGHEVRFNKLRENMLSGKVFRRDGEVFWKCEQCGYIHKGSEAPKVCPSCRHPQAYFSLFCEPY